LNGPIEKQIREASPARKGSVVEKICESTGSSSAASPVGRGLLKNLLADASTTRRRLKNRFGFFAQNAGFHNSPKRRSHVRFCPVNGNETQLPARLVWKKTIAWQNRSNISTFIA